MHLPQQSCGTVTSSWTSSRAAEVQAWSCCECCSDFRGPRGHFCTQNVCVAVWAQPWGCSTVPLSIPIAPGVTQNFLFLASSVNFWPSTQTINARCRNSDQLKFFCVTVIMRSLYLYQKETHCFSKGLY